MPNYLDYQISVSKEFKALEYRVRNLIDDVHPGEEGRYKEAILMNYLRRVLPQNMSVGTGFVRNLLSNEITSQIDIIIYDNTYPLLFSDGDFIIATNENVLGIIEVKSSIRPGELFKIVNKANKNADIIAGGSDISGIRLFNGVFSYNGDSNVDKYTRLLNKHNFDELTRTECAQAISPKIYSCVNHMALGGGCFVKLWPYNLYGEIVPDNVILKYETNYAFYKLPNDLAFSYFLSNIQDIIIRISDTNPRRGIRSGFTKFLYPIEEGKEAFMHKRVYLVKAALPR